MRKTTIHFDEWLGFNEPQDIEELHDLTRASMGDGEGHYQTHRDLHGRLIIEGPGNEPFLALVSKQAELAFAKLVLARYAEWTDMDLHGEVIFQRAMARRD